MKLVLQIALGVFLGSLGSGLIIDYVHAYQDRIIKEAEASEQAKDEEARREQGRRIREMILQGRRKRETSEAGRPPQGLMPNDAQPSMLKNK